MESQEPPVPALQDRILDRVHQYLVISWDKQYLFVLRSSGGIRDRRRFSKRPVIPDRVLTTSSSQGHNKRYQREYSYEFSSRGHACERQLTPSFPPQ